MSFLIDLQMEYEDAVFNKNIKQITLKLKDEELENKVPTDAIPYEKLLEVFMNVKASGLTTVKKQKMFISLIEWIVIFSDRLEIHYGLGRSKIKREMVLTGSL